MDDDAASGPDERPAPRAAANEPASDAATAPDRDPDLEALVGLESELAELDAELARVERADADAEVAEAATRASRTAAADDPG